MSLLSVCQWLENTGWASGIKHSSWQFPVLESVHSLALSVTIFPAALLDLRLLGLIQQRRPVSEVAEQFLAWVWTGFTIMILTGVVLFCSEAVKCYNSPFFRTKLALLAAAGFNALVFHQTIFKKVEQWDQHAATPWRAKLAGACSLLFWVGIVAMGRALAYA